MYTQKQNPPTILNKSWKKPAKEKGNHDKLVLFPYIQDVGWLQDRTGKYYKPQLVDDTGEVLTMLHMGNKKV